MKNEMHEALPPTELPVPEIKASQIPERGNELTRTTELSGARGLELQQRGNTTVPSVNPFSPAAIVPTSKDTTILAISETSTTHPAIADDNDLIEKEWVQKAKAIVAKTKEDPYTQNKEMSRYKADYVKKRFNKDVKLTGEN